MPRQSDANPHFVRPFQTPGQVQHPQTSPLGPSVPQPHPQGGHSEPLSPGWAESQLSEPPPDVEPARRHRSKHPGRKHRPLDPLVSFHPQTSEEHPQPKPQGQQTLPLENQDHEEQNPHVRYQGRQTLPPDPVMLIENPDDHEGQHPPQAKHQGEKTQTLVPQSPRPHRSQGQRQPHQHRQQGLLPHDQQTNLFTWSSGVLCAIFCVVIIIAGLVVLIVYLVFRPRTPKFDVSAATLNAAYLDMGYLLNADVTVLANFTNPNKKVSVDFSYLIIDLYYGTTLIATQYVEPFSAHKRQSMFANVHMEVSQVRLGLLESHRLQREMETNRAVFQVKGSFRARANFGKILRYSYWLHGDCKVVFTRPPEGVLVGRRCKTKH